MTDFTTATDPDSRPPLTLERVKAAFELHAAAVDHPRHLPLLYLAPHQKAMVDQITMQATAPTVREPADKQRRLRQQEHLKGFLARAEHYNRPTAATVGSDGTESPTPNT